MLLTDMKWSDVAALDKNTTPIVFPIAALEQHGRHMPLFTDSMLLGEIMRRSEQQLRDRVVFAPLTWLGNSDHHLDFSGTLSAPPRVYLDMLNGLMENFIMHGFKRLVFVNGHGGNDVPGRQAVFELRQRHRDRADLCLVMATYWLLGAKPWENDRTLVQHRLGHACEYETSMMLRINPHLVGDIKDIEAVDFGNAFEPANRGWITKDRTEPGHIGDPRWATAEKGETLFRAYTQDVVNLLERVLKWDGVTWDA